MVSEIMKGEMVERQKIMSRTKSPMNGSILSLLVRGATVKKAETE